MKNLRFTSILQRAMLYMLLMLLVLCTAHAQLDEVASLLKEQRYTAAAAKLEKLTKSAKDIETRSRCYYQLGEIYYNYTQQYPEALKAYKKILSMRADGLPIAEIFLSYIKIGDVYSRMGEYDKAIHSFRTLVGTAPEIHFVHKIGLQKIRDIRTARKNLQMQKEIVRTYKGTPLEAVAQFQIAELYRMHNQLNQPERAIEIYQELLRKYPTDKLAAEAQWRIAHLRHTVLHQLPLAIDAYKKVADNYPTSNFAAEALFHIANIHREGEAYQQALTVYDSIDEKYPNFWNIPAVFYWSGICYEETQNYYEARNAFNVFLNVYLPTLDPVYLGQIAMYDKSIAEVAEFVRRKIEMIEQRIPKHEFERLEKAVEGENYDEASKIARNLISHAPDTQFAKQAAAQLLSLKHRAAIQNLLLQIQGPQLNVAEKVRTKLQIAIIYERELRDYSKAVTAYNKIVQEHPKSPYAAEARYRMGVIYADVLEKPNSALKAFNIIIEQHPNTLQAMMATFQVGEIYRKLQRFDEALRAYQTTISYPERELYLSDGYKDSYTDRALFRIGRVHFDDQRYTDARFAFEEFIKNRTRSPRLAAAHIYLAVMHQESEKKDTAAEYYQKAEKMLTNNPIQMQMVIDEAGTLGFQSADTVIKFLQDRQKRLKTE